MQSKFSNFTVLKLFVNDFINFSHVRVVGSYRSRETTQTVRVTPVPSFLNLPLTDLCQVHIIVLFILFISRDFLNVILAWFILNRIIKIHALIPPKDVTPQK
jgi:hypothetical protein